VPFPDPVVGGIYLVRFAIRSPNYVQNLQGWTINQDGSAEFSDVVIRGGELLITDPDGSYVRIYDENPGNGAIIEMNPATLPGHTVDPALFRTATGFFTNSADLYLVSPNVDGNGIAFLLLSGSPTQRYAILSADELELTTTHLRVYKGVGTDGFEVTPFSGTVPTTRLSVDGKELGFSELVVNQATPPAATTVAAAFANITGATTGTFNKQHPNTDVVCFMSLGVFATAGGTTARYGLNFSGAVGDVTLGQVLLSAASTDNAASAVVRVSGMAVGSYTVTPRWFRSGGAGTVTMNAATSSLSWYVREIIEP
jgi:hypothetical protein